jgi:LysM repeat protein
MNKAKIGANPNLIKPGTVLDLPGGGKYTVKPGDNLSKIAANANRKLPEELNLIRKLAGL